ncbi:hypothetical protein CRENBAI_002869 [Crenichthys baileyi]|uniref:Uncharacterized protein n=1 Tax=Crenichthys baileyi TaxID=28760 RepID=A0AAV9RBM0_9TELE
MESCRERLKMSRKTPASWHSSDQQVEMQQDAVAEAEPKITLISVFSEISAPAVNGTDFGPMSPRSSKNSLKQRSGGLSGARNRGRRGLVPRQQNESTARAQLPNWPKWCPSHTTTVKNMARDPQGSLAMTERSPCRVATMLAGSVWENLGQPRTANGQMTQGPLRPARTQPLNPSTEAPLHTPSLPNPRYHAHQPPARTGAPGSKTPPPPHI